MKHYGKVCTKPWSQTETIPTWGGKIRKSNPEQMFTHKGNIKTSMFAYRANILKCEPERRLLLNGKSGMWG